MMMSNLPPVLVEEILSRVPPTSLKRLRSTCKEWNNLFKDRRFTENHFRKAAKQFLVLMVKEFRVWSMSANLHEIHENVAAPSLKLNLGVGPTYSHFNSEQVEIYRIFHCDGLLLCTTKNHRLVVWNPCTDQTRWIKHSDRYKNYSEFTLGYENNKSCHSYKILRYWGFGGVDESEVYDFSSDSWRLLDDVNPYCLTREEVSLKGNTYWLASDEKQEKDLLLCFDFSTEIYQFLNLPFQNSDYQTVSLSVVREEKLSVLQKRLDTPEMEIWVTTNDKCHQTTKDLSWSKFLAINPFTCCHWSDSVSFFIDEEKRIAMCCDGYVRDRGGTSIHKVYIIGEDKCYGEISVGGFAKLSHRPYISNYVPSLVQIPQATVN